MELKFSASIRAAIFFLENIRRGEIYTWVEGWDRDPKHSDPVVKKLESFAWGTVTGFFFDRIKASPIRRTQRVEFTQEEHGHWKLARSVHFYLGSQLRATVELIGTVFDGPNPETNLGNASSWEVSKVSYIGPSGNWLMFTKDVLVRG